MPNFNKIFLTIGFFDGVHLGHMHLIDIVKKLAEKYNCSPGVFTFGDDFFESLLINENLIDLQNEKEQKLKELGVEHVYIVNNSKKFIKMTAKEFECFLLNEFNLAGIVIGEDFRYGVNAEKGASDLSKFLLSHGLVCQIEPLLLMNNRKISSNSIRRLITEGKIEEANGFLYKPFSITGKVIGGRGEGRKYGVRTANLAISPRKILPPPGVYATKTIIGTNEYKSLTHIGPCPTFDYFEISLETLIIDFNDDIYNQNIKVIFTNKIRENIKFNNKEDLKKQIELDKKEILV